MSLYIPYVMTLRPGAPTAAEIRAVDDRLGSFAFRIDAISRAAMWPVKVLGRGALRRRGDVAIGAVVASSAARPGQGHPEQGPAWEPATVIDPKAPRRLTVVPARHRGEHGDSRVSRMDHTAESRGREASSPRPRTAWPPEELWIDARHR
jgi:hypothetical protein